MGDWNSLFRRRYSFAQQRDVGINATQSTKPLPQPVELHLLSADIGKNLFIGTTNCGYIVGLGTDALGTSPNVAVKVTIFAKRFTCCRCDYLLYLCGFYCPYIIWSIYIH